MTVRKDKQTGLWLIDISGGVNPVTGKRRRHIKRGIKTRREAITLEPQLRIQKFGDSSKIKGITIDLLYTLSQEEDRNNHRRDTYLHTQEVYYRKHFMGYFENAKIDKLTPKDMEIFRQTLIKKNLEASTINRLMAQLSKLFNTAVKHGFRPDNPCLALRKLPESPKTINYWTLDEFNTFMSLFEVEEYPYQLFFKVAFSTGMRKGELLALTWEDVDFSRQTINVNKTLVRLPDGQMSFHPPKTKSGYRSITIHKSLTQELQTWRDKQKELLTPYCEDPNTLQLFQFIPEPLNEFRVKRAFDKVMSRTDKLKEIRIHDFRHSHVALLIENEESPYVIKERLGHKSIKTTYNTYGHLYPNRQKSLSDKLDGLF